MPRDRPLRYPEEAGHARPAARPYHRRGAYALADCPVLRGLSWLGLDRNALTESGYLALRRVVKTLRGRDQQTQTEVNSDYPPYLTEGEFE